LSILEVRNLTKVYGEGHSQVVALENVSLDLERGQMLAVLGPSGSGKTTLLSIIAGLLTPTSGEVLINGEQIGIKNARTAATYRRAHIGIVFQDYHLIPYLNALENLLLIPHLSGRPGRADRERAKRLLNEFDLEMRAKHSPNMLSGGERQRVAVARALMNDPEIMLVDEPTSNLDTQRGQQVVEMIRRHIHSRQMSCVMVSHDPRMCGQADKTLELLDGKVV
jgi:putative ABC transport system ATP-binding protein